MDILTNERGLTLDTIERFELGWDPDKHAYTIPIRDEEGRLANIRRYTPHPPTGRRKIWSVDGMGAPRLYPVEILAEHPSTVVVCEGELDALITIQQGYAAITRTGSAKVWKPEWAEHFNGSSVLVCQDSDKMGQDGNRLVARALQRAAKQVKIVKLPYKVTDKHGKDLTDFWTDGHSREDFEQLIAKAEPYGKAAPVEPVAPATGSINSAQDATRIGQAQQLEITVKGRWSKRFSVPQKVRYECTRDAGEKCATCPLNAAGGEDELTIEATDPVVLELMESSKGQVNGILRNMYGAPVCVKLEITAEQHQSAEILYARDNIDYTRNGAGIEASSYEAIKITSVGRHDTQPNTTVRVIGAVQPDPRKQYTEFQAWELLPLETSLDNYTMTAASRKRLSRFQPERGQSPIRKLRQIAGEMERHVTRIYGRPELHALLDLAFHSALMFKFAGRYERKGWLDVLIIGDTRTGKSEAASALIHHYNVGEIVSCEAASFAGIIGGLQTFGRDGKEWSVTWGVVPLNDRRIVVLDEISGLTSEQIGAMSSVRSSGIAELQKIVQERTSARTRLVWMGNPRSGRKMSDYTYGVQAIRPLIGTNEDIARFDLAMSLRQDEVPSGDINRPRRVGRQRYTSEACHELLRWVWSRQPDQVVWAGAAERMVYRAANDLGQRYVEEPPLIQGANVRTKVARVSVALAARLFSTDRSGEQIVVRPEHVRDAVKFIDHLYGMKNFGYRERSQDVIHDRKRAFKNKAKIKHYLLSREGLPRFLRDNGEFRRQDLETMLNYTREEAAAVVNMLWDARMVRRNGPDVLIEPTLHDVLRRMEG